jgi:hypothetical protein
MDRREKHRQHKEKDREQTKKEDQAYEDVQEKRRLPVHPAWLVVAGIVLTALVV